MKVALPGLISLFVFVGLWAASFVLEGRVASRFKDTVRMIRGLLLPCFAALWAVEVVCGYNRDTAEFKLVETIVGFGLVWFVASTLQSIFLADARSSAIRSRTPRLLVDIVRLSFVVVGMVMVYSGVWHKDISPLLTTFGVGSLVVGLALQDTLGNLFAGLSLVFERPVAVGDWVQLGDTIGKVRQITWRSVRIVTRELNEITIPNSAIGKDRILNFSSPTKLHGFKITVGFSYDAPPSVVKEMLRTTALDTPGISTTPAPDARTIDFAASSVTYELRVFIDDYEMLSDVRNDLMSRIWYAARRAGIQIPYPIRTVYKTEMPYLQEQRDDDERLLRVLPTTELFKDLSDAEARVIRRAVFIQRFGHGEDLLREGEGGDHFFVLLEGNCSVLVNGASATPITVASVGPGAVVGEMALLAGAERTATVRAATEVLAARIGKGALTNLLELRPDLIESFARYAAEKSKAINEARVADNQIERAPRGSNDSVALGERIRRFLGLVPQAS
jgi:small-conductance mechanosensitive channel/CRP-like cAMP-binding protein